MTLDLIETLKTPIYSPNHTQNTNIFFFKKEGKEEEAYNKHFQTIKFKNKLTFYADVYGTIYISC